MYVGASTRLIRGTLSRLAWLGVERIREIWKWICIPVVAIEDYKIGHI